MGSVLVYSSCIIHEGNPLRGERRVNKASVEEHLMHGVVCSPICCGTGWLGGLEIIKLYVSHRSKGEVESR